jgi:hypothetical protein
MMWSYNMHLILFNNWMKYLCKGYIKNDTIFEPLMDFFFVTTFQNCESEHDHGHCGCTNVW